MTPPDPAAPPAASPDVAPARRGLAHVLAASGYSWAGLRRLAHERAARLELGAAALSALAFLVVGANLVQWLVLACLWMFVLAVEALNTAIEVLVDKVSPDWSIEAKHAKDLGSLAVALSLAVTGIYVGAVLLGL